MSATWRIGTMAPSSRPLVLLLLFLQELRHDERQVVADEPGPVHEEEPADDARGHAQHDDRVADTDGVGEEAGDDPAGRILR